MFHLLANLLKRTLIIVLALALLPFTPATAQTRNEEIIIRADRATLNQQTGNAQYEGNAELVQGSRRMTADRITLTLQNNRPIRVEAYGNPVTLNESSGAEAKAQHIIYDLSERKVSLYENASINHQGRIFECAELEYYLDTEQVEASGDGEGDRVKLVIPAEPEETEE